MFDELLQTMALSQEANEAPTGSPMMSVEEDNDDVKRQETYPMVLPILPLKNTVLFPGVIIPITVGREKSIRAVQKAFDSHKLIGVLAQRDSNNDSVAAPDLFEVGTIARILRLLKMPDGTTTAVLQGRKRFRSMQVISDDPYMISEILPLEYEPRDPDNELNFNALTASIRDKAQRVVELTPNLPNEANVMLRNINNDVFLLNFITSNMNVKTPIKQKILEINDLAEKATTLLQHLDSELQHLELRGEIEQKVRGEVDKQQRDYLLNQQLKTIQEELGGNSQEQELNALAERGKKKKWTEAVAKQFQKELTKVRRMPAQAAEYSIMLNYLETLLDLPWNEVTEDNFDLKTVQQTLDQDHFGLEDVKSRILEHLAVLKLKGDMKAPILLLVGPPGVGKTSLGKSVANALHRKFIRMSLGGLHDESEIRGHRKTYIGAMPGRIVQSMRKAGSSNPVFILDEIDKVGTSFRGDPSSALLEVLDPEQNSTFYDNYLETEYDLSKVLFIATANSLETIQPALLDRMEIIRLAGYSVEEKIEIAKQHLVPERRIEHGLAEKDIRLTNDVIAQVIQDYTRESGVRSLDRRLAAVMRYVAKKVAFEEKYRPNIMKSDLKEILGAVRFSKENYENNGIAGVAIGLAWTQVGGDILFIETSLSKGKGNLTLTGNLGAVMKESATTALSFIKSHIEELGIDDNLLENKDIHIHVPEGAIPKDGPSAGVTMLTALVSAFKKQPVKPHLAMTGEITLRGKVLPVGGIKEKVLAAKRAGCTDIILCRENQKDIAEITAAYLKGIHFHYVDKMLDVVQIALS
ncbi:MAG: endopeptidase La [Bacteroidota bacterium]|jgi:ATP-dependent Lon protease